MTPARAHLQYSRPQAPVCGADTRGTLLFGRPNFLILGPEWRMCMAIGTAPPLPARLRAGVALFGPAFVAAIAYVDPGNVATNSQAGARYGALLAWVVVAASGMAALVQYLSAKLGLATGRSLPELLRDRLPRAARLAYWGQAEVIAMATDLAELLGGAIAMNLLFGLPLAWGGVLTGVLSTLLLHVQNGRGQRPFERLITMMLIVIAIGFAAGVVLRPPAPAEVLAGLVPRFAGSGSVLLATGMLGATVMPHAIYLHSALARDRHGRPSGGRLRRLVVATRYEIAVAMAFAGLINLVLLVLAATSLGGSAVDTIQGVHAAIEHSFGPAIAALFAVGLLASGLASTSVGCYAGAVVMDGLLRRRIPLLARRVITVIPAVVLLTAGVDPTSLLLLSQVALSFGIPFALVPLVILTTRRSVMGAHANRSATTVSAVLIVAAVIVLNLALIWLTFR
jgi:manganese transport protein